MDGAALLQQCRERLRDTKNPKLWSDDSLMLYLNQAQIEFAEATHWLLDFDTYTITTTTGNAVYSLDAKVVSPIVVQGDDETAPLRRKVGGLPLSFNTTTTGLPRYYYPVAGTPRRIVVYPTPTADDVKTYNMVTAVLPSADITHTTEPEISYRWHLKLVDGAVVYALSHSDTDGFAPEQLSIAAQNWGITLRDAKREAYRTIASFNTVAQGLRA